MSNQDYLGDSVYVDYDGYHVILTTNNGYGTTNRIALDPDVLRALQNYLTRITPQKPEDSSNGDV